MNDDAGAIARVRELLADADYSARGITAIGVDVGLGVRRTDVAVLSRALKDQEPLATLVRLFLLGEAIEPAHLEGRLAAHVPALTRLGLVERKRGRISATLSITPWADLLVAHDPDPAGDLWSSHVTGPNPAAETLAQITVRAPVRSALDLGTGSGVLALLAARHSERVTATDINARAVKLTSLNAGLNGVDNVQTREGSFFEPVDDERFELIVSNPPFVISPESGLVFRYGTLPRDEVSRQILIESAGHLEEGGIAAILCNWIVAPTGEWLAMPRRWLADSGSDVLVLLHAIEDPLAYSVRWNTRLQQLAPDRFARTLDLWLEYYEREGIDSIASGAVIVRRRHAATPWVHGLRVDSETGRDGGRQILAILGGQDYLSGITDERAMLADAFRLPDLHRLDQSLVYRDDRYTIEPATLVIDDGLGVRGTIDPTVSAVIPRLDGSRPLGVVLEELAADGDGGRDRVITAGLALARRLLGLGLLEPVRAAAPGTGRS